MITLSQNKGLLKFWRFAKAVYYHRSKGWTEEDFEEYFQDYDVTIYSHENMVAIACEDDDELIISIAGTDDFEDNIKNLMSLRQIPYPFETSKTRIAKGFYKNIDLLDDRLVPRCRNAEITNEKTVSLCGHSAGAAAATILADMLTRRHIKWKNLFPFESPRVFCPSLAKEFEEMNSDKTVVRLVHGSDPVTHVPTCLRFRHVGTEWWLPRSYKKRAKVGQAISMQFWSVLKALRLFRSIRDHYCDDIDPRLKFEYTQQIGLLDD